FRPPCAPRPPDSRRTPRRTRRCGKTLVATGSSTRTAVAGSGSRCGGIAASDAEDDHAARVAGAERAAADPARPPPLRAGDRAREKGPLPRRCNPRRTRKTTGLARGIARGACGMGAGAVYFGRIAPDAVHDPPLHVEAAARRKGGSSRMNVREAANLAAHA